MRNIRLSLSYNLLVIILAVNVLLTLSFQVSAEQLELNKSIVKEFSSKELLVKIKEYPSHSGYKDKLEVIFLKGGTKIIISFDRSKQTLPVAVVGKSKIDTGQIEGFMQEECISKNDRAICLFYYRNVIVVKSHFNVDDVEKYGKIIEDLNNFGKSDYWSKIQEILSMRKKEGILVCTPISTKP